MSIVTIQIGQCGNQIGENFFETIYSDCFNYKGSRGTNGKRANDSVSFGYDERNDIDYVYGSVQRFFDENPTNNKLTARSILIDMESKVINKIMQRSQLSRDKWSFRAVNAYTQKQGSGNNWTYGYCVNAPKSLEDIENIVRQEAERCDRLSSFLICMSLAGGTGSGVGSYYTEMLREHYPRTCIVNTCVCPYSSGEVVLQNYNYLLTLNKIYKCSDALILLENDQLHKICARMGPTKAQHSSGISKKNQEIALKDLNDVVGHKLASVLQPSTNHCSGGNNSNEIFAELCPNSDYKLLSLANIPIMSKQSIEFSSFKWPGMYRHAKQLLFTGGFMEDELNWSINAGVSLDTNSAAPLPRPINKSIALSLFARGYINSMDEHDDLTRNTFDSHFLDKYFAKSSWRPSFNRISLWQQQRQFNQYEKSLSLLSNSQMPAYKIEAILKKAWCMYSSKAYIHQYLKYSSFNEEQLLNAFIFSEQLVKNYMKI